MPRMKSPFEKIKNKRRRVSTNDRGVTIMEPSEDESKEEGLRDI